jgi:hypothetical protein
MKSIKVTAFTEEDGAFEFVVEESDWRAAMAKSTCFKSFGDHVFEAALKKVRSFTPDPILSMSFHNCWHFPLHT